MGKSNQTQRYLAVRTSFCLLMTGIMLSFSISCSMNPVEEKNPSANTVAVGSLSMTYPSELSVFREEADTSYLPDTMAKGVGVTLMSEDYSVMFELLEVSDPDHQGISALEKYWRQNALNLYDENKLDEIDSKFPGMRGLAESTTLDEPEQINLNGQNTLKVSWSAKDSIKTVIYYIEENNEIVGIVQGMFPLYSYEDNPDFYDSIFSSIRVD